jgi:hypothetical protein
MKGDFWGWRGWMGVLEMPNPRFKSQIRSGVVGHACNPSTLEAETGESRVWGQFGYIVRFLPHVQGPEFKTQLSPPTKKKREEKKKGTKAICGSCWGLSRRRL